MLALDDPTRWHLHEARAKMLLALEDRRDWILRRVETVRLLNTTQLERLVTLDIDTAELRRMSNLAGLVLSKKILVPLSVLPKSLLLDLDVRDATDSAVHVTVSDKDSAAAQLLILARLQSCGVAISSLSPDILRLIYQAAHEMPNEADLEALTASTDATRRQMKTWRNIGSTASPEGWPKLIEENNTFVRLLAQMTINYQPMVELAFQDLDICVIKYRILESQMPERIRLPNHLRLRALGIVIEAPSIGLAQREHLRFEAPPGLFIEGAAFYPDAVMTLSTDGHDLSYLEIRVTPDRSVLYTRSFPKGHYELLLLLRPRLSGFLRPAQFTVLASALLLYLGALSQLIGAHLSRVATSDRGSAVALLITVPSVMSALLAREGEHELLSDYLRWPRIAVAGSTGLSVLAAGWLAIGVRGRIGLVWLLCALGCSLVLLLLVRIGQMSGRAFGLGIERSRMTFAASVSVKVLGEQS
ncbi:MAG: hypothetical protein ACYDAQ_00660 [Mycobacteriales bacterium]